MKIPNLIGILGSVGIFFLCGDSCAQYLPKLSGYFEQKITRVEQGVSAMAAESPERVFANMVLTDINVDINASVSFGISNVLSLSISPEIDIVLTPEAAR